MEDLYQIGIGIVLMVQDFGEWLLAPMQLISFLGSAEFYLLIMPFLYWSIDAALGLRVGVILLSSDAISYYLKISIHSARPFWFSRGVESYAFEYSFGMPSSHAQNSAAVFGLLAASLKRSWVWLASIVLIILIGISRIYLAVHFPQDVILGWIVGFLLVWLFLRFEKPVSSWFSSRSLPVSTLALFLVSIAMLLFGLLLRSLAGGWQIPAAWIENARLAFPAEEAIEPFKFSSLLLTSGVFFGITAGALWLFRSRGFNARGSWIHRILRYPVGVAGVAVLWFGIGTLLPDQGGIPVFLARYVLYAAIGFWISALAPLIFMRIKLCEQNE